MTTSIRSTSPLKLGFIGGGVNSAIGSAHFAASMLDDRFRVVSGCFSRDPQVNRDTARRWHIDPTACFTDWREYLHKSLSEIDALCILTPIPDHHEMLIAALDLNIPVICEKALVSNSVDASVLQARYSNKPHFLAVTLNYSGYPVVRLLRDLIGRGELGVIKQIDLEMPLENYARIPKGKEEPAKPQIWRQSDGTIPTLLLDLGVHLHHLMHYTTGANASSVMAQLNHFSTMPGIVDDARLWIECDTGLQATMWMSKTALGNRNGMRLRVFGDKGSAQWYQFEPEILQMTDVNGVNSQLDRGIENEVLGTSHYNRFKAGHPAGYIEAFGNLYWDMADALHQYKQSGSFSHPDIFGVEHARDGLALLESAVESHRRRQWTSVKAEAYVDNATHSGMTDIRNVRAA